jgi:hypothetical protein
MRQSLMPCKLISTTIRHQRRSQAVVMPPSILCNKFYILCIYFVCGRVLVFLEDPFFMNFDLIIVVSVPSHPLQRGFYSHIQIIARPTLTKGSKAFE